MHNNTDNDTVYFLVVNHMTVLHFPLKKGGKGLGDGSGVCVCVCVCVCVGEGVKCAI